MTVLITEDLLALDVEVPDRAAVTRLLAERLAGAGRVTDLCPTRASCTGCPATSQPPGGPAMPERRVVVGSSVGLHARPAALFTQAAAKVGVPVTITKVGGEGPVDARSILLVLTLGVGQGDEVVIAADGEGADAALDHLAALLASDLDASPTGS